MVEKAGRNDPCPCGSGKKYKNCHMLLEKEATSAKYTPSGKRKFKAKVISSSEKSLSIFGRSATAPQPPTSSATLEKLKFRMTNKDYRAPVEREQLPFPIPSPAESTAEKPKERERHLPQPDEAFKPTKEDFRKKKE